MWVARDKDGSLAIYRNCPSRLKSEWIDETSDNDHDGYLAIDEKLFANLRWEDEPIEVSLVPTILNSVQEKLTESTRDLNFDDYEFNSFSRWKE